MKESELNKRVNFILNEFDGLPTIEPSALWNEALIQKLQSAPSKAVNRKSYAAVIVAAFFILLNVVIILNAIKPNQELESTRKVQLESISKELLINTISIKN